MNWFRRLFHKHVWRDAFVFDSCIELTIPTGETRVVARAVMMQCEFCEAMQRRALTKEEQE